MSLFSVSTHVLALVVLVSSGIPDVLRGSLSVHS